MIAPKCNCDFEVVIIDNKSPDRTIEKISNELSKKIFNNSGSIFWMRTKDLEQAIIMV